MTIRAVVQALKTGELTRDEVLTRGEEIASTCPRCGEKIWAGDEVSREGMFTIHASCVRTLYV